MSKIGKKPISIPESVQVSVTPEGVKVKGPKGELVFALHPRVSVTMSSPETAVVSVKNPEDRRQRALWGTFRALLQNAIQGVTAGFEKQLEIHGVGYKAQAASDKLVLNIGFSHPVELAIPAGLSVSVEKNIITISGANKHQVGQFAAVVRGMRKPEPYKGKGIKYTGEVIRRKAGKVVKAVGT